MILLIIVLSHLALKFSSKHLRHVVMYHQRSFKMASTDFSEHTRPAVQSVSMIEISDKSTSRTVDDRKSTAGSCKELQLHLRFHSERLE